MAYIIDLTLIMQNTFWLLEVSGQTTISRRLIKLAFKSYTESTIKAQVHVGIEDYVRGAGVSGRGDNALTEVIDLINLNRIESRDMVRLRDLVGEFVVSGDDEPWDAVPESNSRRR